MRPALGHTASPLGVSFGVCVCVEGGCFHWDHSEKVTKVWRLLLVVFSLFYEWRMWRLMEMT